MKKKADLSINIVIIAVIALSVLVVLSYIFVGKLNPCSNSNSFSCIQYRAEHQKEFDEKLHSCNVDCEKAIYFKDFNDLDLPKCSILNESAVIFRWKSSHWWLFDNKIHQFVPEKCYIFIPKPFCSLCTSFWDECMSEEKKIYTPKDFNGKDPSQMWTEKLTPKERFEEECECLREGFGNLSCEYVAETCPEKNCNNEERYIGEYIYLCNLSELSEKQISIYSHKKSKCLSAREKSPKATEIYIEAKDCPEWGSGNNCEVIDMEIYCHDHPQDTTRCECVYDNKIYCKKLNTLFNDDWDYKLYRGSKIYHNESYCLNISRDKLHRYEAYYDCMWNYDFEFDKNVCGIDCSRLYPASFSADDTVCWKHQLNCSKAIPKEIKTEVIDCGHTKIGVTYNKSAYRGVLCQN